MTRACDHSTGNARIGAQLKLAGYDGILRYAAYGRTDVNITPGEVSNLIDNGIEIGIVNEHEAAYLLGGYNVGHRCAIETRDITRQCGLPDGVIYFAGDSESLQASQTNMEVVRQAMMGAAAVVGNSNVGFYGSYYVIDYLVHYAPWIEWYWQTVAWSSGNVHPHAQILQLAEAATIGGVSIDIDEIRAANWGQRTAHPTPVHHDVTEDNMIAAVTRSDGGMEVFVETKSGEVMHTWTDKDGTWHGDPGKTLHKWESLGNPTTQTASK